MREATFLGIPKFRDAPEWANERRGQRVKIIDRRELEAIGSVWVIQFPDGREAIVFDDELGDVWTDSE